MRRGERGSLTESERCPTVLLGSNKDPDRLTRFRMFNIPTQSGEARQGLATCFLSKKKQNMEPVRLLEGWKTLCNRPNDGELRGARGGCQIGATHARWIFPSFHVGIPGLSWFQVPRVQCKAMEKGLFGGVRPLGRFPRRLFNLLVLAVHPPCAGAE